jgi:hypothetical protein
MSPATWAALGFSPLPEQQAARLEAQGRALAGQRAPALRMVEPLAQRSVALYPASEYLQREWIRAVKVVRRTSGGWLLDKKAVRRA